MPTTARRSKGRAGAFACPCLLLAALAATAQPPAILDQLCTALRNGDSKSAESLFAARTDLTPLTSLAEIQCTVEDNTLTLELASKQNGPPIVRKSAIDFRTDKDGKIVSFAPGWMLAKPDGRVFKPIADLSAALGENNGPAALSTFDSAMREYGEISNDLDALTTQTDVLCAIDIVADYQSDTAHNVDTDWYLELKSRADAGPSERRRERVRLQLQPKKNSWRITGISPLNILSPLKIN